MGRMVPPFAIFFLAQALLALLAQHAQAAHFLRAGQVDEKDATLSLALELGGGLSPQRHAEFEDALRTTYAALPKDSHGHLSHKAVRYVLHRLFVQRHGWYIKGLDPQGDGNISGMEWVPSFLQERLEERSGERGANLNELAALAAALEDLVQKEAARRLQTAYEVHQLPMDVPISRDQMIDVTSTYFISFLLANKLSATNPEEIHHKQHLFVEKYKDWPEAKAWFQKTILNMSGAEENDYEAEIGETGETFGFETVTSSVIKIGEEYHGLNDRECRDLKSTLLGIEDHKAGRVRLSEFYKMGMHSHWQFTEKAEYLRSLGALDASDPAKPRVIVTNYVMGRMNCLEASNMYALCCRNECEDLMGHLEGEIGSAEAQPARVAELVAAMPSDTVQAPRNLSASLLARLEEVAARNGGAVPLHSRLFAQWMHHAYPRECPYPHEAGTTSGAQTPDEWMQETGHSSTAATEEEMIKQVESECTASYDGSTPQVGGVVEDEEEESAELPWSDAEEQFAATAAPAPMSASKRGVLGARGAKILLLGLLSFLAFLLMMGWKCIAWRELRGRRGLLDGDIDVHEGISSRLALSVGVCILVTAAYFLELLDTTVFAVALLAGVVVTIASGSRRPTFKVV